MVEYIAPREFEKMTGTARMYYVESVAKISNKQKREFLQKIIICCSKAPEIADKIEKKANELVKTGKYDIGIIEKMILKYNKS